MIPTQKINGMYKTIFGGSTRSIFYAKNNQFFTAARGALPTSHHTMLF